MIMTGEGTMTPLKIRLRFGLSRIQVETQRLKRNQKDCSDLKDKHEDYKAQMGLTCSNNSNGSGRAKKK